MHEAWEIAARAMPADDTGLTEHLITPEGLATLFEVQAMLLEPFGGTAMLLQTVCRSLAAHGGAADVLAAQEEGEHRHALSCPCMVHAGQRVVAADIVRRAVDA